MLKYQIHIIWIVALCLFCYAASDLSLLNTTHAGHHYFFNTFRTAAMADAISHGDLGRWVPEFAYGWGYPLFYFTGPLPYIPGGLTYAITGNLPVSVNISWWLAVLLAPIIMFIVLRKILDLPGAFLGSVLYCFAPYRFVDIYVRTNLGETWIFAIAPLLLLAFWHAPTSPRKSILIGAPSLALIFLTHLASIVVLGIGFGVVGMTMIMFMRNERTVIFSSFLGIILLGICLSGFFSLPAILEISSIKGTAALTEDYFDYSQHFVYPAQLISTKWGYKGSMPGPNDNMSFALGLIPLILAALGTLASLISIIKKSKNEDRIQKSLFFLTLTFGALTTIGLSLAVSDFIWSNFSSLQIIQFPWRFHLTSSLLISALGGYFFTTLSSSSLKLKHTSLLVALVSAISIAFFHSPYLVAQGRSPIPSEDGDMKHLKKKGVTTTITGEFYPRDVTQFPETNDIPKNLVATYTNQRVSQRRIESVTQMRNRLLIELKEGAEGLLIVRQFWFPSWKATISGQAAETFPLTDKAFKQHAFAPIGIKIGSKQQQIEVFFGRTTMASTGLFLSIFGLLFTLWMFFRRPNHR